MPPMNPASAQHVVVSRAMYCPAAQIGDDFFRFFAFHPQLLCCRDVELAKDLYAYCTVLFLKEAGYQIHGLAVFGPRSALVRVHENVRINEFNAHVTRPASTGSCLWSLDRARSGFSPGTAAWPFPSGHLARSSRELPRS